MSTPASCLDRIICIHPNHARDWSIFFWGKWYTQEKSLLTVTIRGPQIKCRWLARWASYRKACRWQGPSLSTQIQVFQRALLAPVYFPKPSYHKITFSGGHSPYLPVCLMNSISSMKTQLKRQYFPGSQRVSTPPPAPPCPARPMLIYSCVMTLHSFHCLGPGMSPSLLVHRLCKEGTVISSGLYSQPLS